jgi:hypothetical protein
MTEMGQRDADLMQEARLELDLDERRLREDTNRCHALARGATFRSPHDGDACGTMLSDGEREIHATGLLEATRDECQVGLPHAMIREGATQPPPLLVVRREEQGARRLDIETMDHARAQPPLPNAQHPGPPRDHGVQHGIVLIG